MCQLQALVNPRPDDEGPRRDRPEERPAGPYDGVGPDDRLDDEEPDGEADIVEAASSSHRP